MILISILFSNRYRLYSSGLRRNIFVTLDYTGYLEKRHPIIAVAQLVEANLRFLRMRKAG